MHLSTSFRLRTLFIAIIALSLTACPEEDGDSTCESGSQNGDETDVDCGGPQCDGCADGLRCVVDSDCESGNCDHERCRPEGESCEDGVLNGAETDVDCGGGCDPCQAGSDCESDNDCYLGECNGGTCSNTSCDSDSRDHDETDVDCGGPICDPCEQGEACTEHGDCVSDICTAGVCTDCTDAAANGDETDVDCGGDDCDPCVDGLICAENADCDSLMCQKPEPTVDVPNPEFGVCVSCMDETQNGDETGVDCGGGDCEPCPGGEGCVEPLDCLSEICVESLCTEPSCEDEVQNVSETDVDCGGDDCDPCMDGLGCVESSDCLSELCEDGSCVSCSDGLLNGEESDVDCGGRLCPLCAGDLDCNDGRDCASGICTAEAVCAITCDDGLRDGEETDVDCGGPDCDPCGEGATCSEHSDCISEACLADHCLASCTDGVQDGAETGVDCGGGEESGCDACPTGEACAENSDCVTDLCLDEACREPRCDDEVMDGAETDVDCGGGAVSGCPRCPDGDGCGGGEDCRSGVCTRSLCQVPTCRDEVRNGAETGIDCGGGEESGCGVCPAGQGCRDNEDCDSGVCEDLICREPACDDGILNGAETALDCGGGEASGCDPCPTDSDCDDGEDCASGVCDDVCLAPTCVDRVANGSESDVDCGGSCPDRCAMGLGCRRTSDCTDVALCVDGACALPRTCAHLLRERAETESGAVTIDPDLDGPVPPATVFCDMETDDGGWTLVASTSNDPLQDKAIAYHDDLATTNPGRAHDGVWAGMRSLAVTPGDLRFSCKSDDTAVSMTVDLSFYDVSWYFGITLGDDEESCFFNGDCESRETPAPARRNNLTGDERDEGDLWDAEGCLVGEETCNAAEDFSVDFDDMGVGGDGSDGTDWGQVDGEERCGGPLRHTRGQWFIWFRENEEVFGTGLGGVCEEDTDCEGAMVCIEEACALPPSCLSILLKDSAAPSGIHEIDPDGDGAEAPRHVFCDMETDDGGWTLVASTYRGTLNDQAAFYYESLTTLVPSLTHGGVWNGLRSLAEEGSDIRFGCKLHPEDDDFEVDLLFFDTDWYMEITTGADAESCFNEEGAEGEAPARMDVIAGLSLEAGDGWTETDGLLIGEDNCSSIDDFTVDFDDRGMDGDEADGTDWGEDDGVEKCGTETPENGAWFIWVREVI